ncbi:hypothetical protein [Spiroplasma taiwanense]|uniref:Transmembrane protein n=1 Tax=Spiroplasma taiwanense CT-1 TaxID=1276220 RepID=S5MH91_9MOLU|nr:hypothetical protein [Spiroplasma taiwanense]AGR41200.1 hypothetical protein STAIW_v1c05780 [Spiroplasma taiwanense CT-1]
MKNFKYFIILFISLLDGVVFYLLSNSSKEENSQITNLETYQVYFKVKYDIKLKQNRLLPIKLTNENKINDLDNFIEEKKIDYLYNFFSIDNNKELLKKNEIIVYPLENTEIVKTSRYIVNFEFFKSKDVSENISKKTVLILNDIKND